MLRRAGRSPLRWARTIWLSTTLRLGTGLNTLHSSVRYLLLMCYTLPDFTVTVGPVPRTIISLQVGSPHMTVGGVAKAIDAQGTKPLISNGTTMVPIRAIVESLGGSVGWNAPARRCDIRLGSRTVTTLSLIHISEPTRLGMIS